MIPIHAQNYAPLLFMGGIGAPNSTFNYSFANGLYGNFVPYQSAASVSVMK